MKKIAVILPVSKSDYLANTVLDGLVSMANEVEFRVTDNFPSPFSLVDHIIAEPAFISYAQSADLIILCWGKGSTNFALAEKIGRWEKTVFVDGSELGKDRRWDATIQHQVVDMTYEGNGAIDAIMLSKCKRYFRREKPYIKGILPFPFGIERRYRTHFDSSVKKDIDFVCIFGQEDYPKMRKDIRLAVEKFCKKNDYTCVTKKTSGFDFDDSTKLAGRDEFYSLLSRAKVGISVGGGGYDTARFWEILGNNCALLTEKIDIEIPGGMEYSRIREFTDLADFVKKLEEVSSDFPTLDAPEFNAIIEAHSTESRVRYLINKSL